MKKNQKHTRGGNSLGASGATYIWNTISGMLMAFQSVVMLMVLMRVCDVITAGIFTIAYANANLFLMVGKYGMRGYQATDVTLSYSYRSYFHSRAITTMLMVMAGLVYLGYAFIKLNYSDEKIFVFVVLLLFKAIDSIEDVVVGNCQQHDKLDVGAKVQSLRIASTMIVFSVLVVILGSLSLPLVASTLYSSVFYLCECIYLKRCYGLPSPDENGSSSVLGLLKECLSPFLSSFLLFYLCNAPKYAIDAIAGDADQAVFGFISMPVFVVSLFASFAYNPVLTTMAESWESGRKKQFLEIVLRQSLLVVGITLVCDVAAWLIGIPVLNIIYYTNLNDYLVDLVVLVTSGGFVALATFFTYCVVVIRRQRALIPSYVITCALALFTSPWAVGQFGIAGATWSFFLLTLLLSILLCSLLIVEMLKSR